METSRIAELLRPFLGSDELSPAQLQSLQAYLSLLLRWNKRTNLTAVRDEDSIVMRHFGESLFAARHLLGGKIPAHKVVDVGSGAGFPGLPLKIYAPEISLTLIESQTKKATFLKEAIRTMQLKDVSVYAGRAEDYSEKADLVTMRAVERFSSTLATAASLVRGGFGDDGGEKSLALAEEARQSGAGRIGLMIGAAQVREAQEILPQYAWDLPVGIPCSASRVVLAGRPTVTEKSEK